MKKNKVKNQLLEELKRIPIVQVACEKCGVSRNSFYKWKREDEEYEKQIEEALDYGVAFVNDMSESQLLTMIKEKNWSAISFWLRHRNPKYKDKVEVTTKIVDDKLTPEQEEIVRKALELGSIIKTEDNIKEEHGEQQ
jgi:ACT domain-containing protein